MKPACFSAPVVKENMIRNSANVLLAVIIVIAMTGCSLRRSSPKQPCPPYVTQRGDIGITEKALSAGVTCDFGGIPSYEIVRSSLFDQLAAGNKLKIDLLEAACMAAKNSEIADLIEAERHAINCQSSDGHDNIIDIILLGESLEQRNRAAGEAAELFLGLVQVQLQRELIEESKTHLAQLSETIQAAENAGFATAEGANELAEGNIRLKEAESALSSTEQKLMYQLNLRINIDLDNLWVIQPVHELALAELEIDVREQTDIAENSRPGILAIEQALSKPAGAGIESIYRLLGQFDPRLGMRLSPAPIKKVLIRRQLSEILKQDSARDTTVETRRGQAQQILDAKKKEARIEASDAMLRLQSSLESLAIFNENIARLESKAQQLKAKNVIDAQDSYLEQNRNRVELQQAKSDRITAAIEHETAKIKLLQSQGHLVIQCGHGFRPQSTTPKYWYCQ